MFGGEPSFYVNELSDTVVLEFGEYTIVMKHSVLHVCMICKYQYVIVNTGVLIPSSLYLKLNLTFVAV